MEKSVRASSALPRHSRPVDEPCEWPTVKHWRTNRLSAGPFVCHLSAECGRRGGCEFGEFGGLGGFGGLVGLVGPLAESRAPERS